jgi:hypothetical protein
MRINSVRIDSPAVDCVEDAGHGCAVRVFPTGVRVFAQTVLPRLPAAVSPAPESASATYETAIAVGPDRAMAVFHVDSGAGIHIGFARAQLSGGTWTWVEEDVINPNQDGHHLLADPSVAYDAITGEFLVCAIRIYTVEEQAVRDIVVARWNGTVFEAWQPLYTAATFIKIDKPWIVAGDMQIPTGPMSPIVREFYIFWVNGANGNHLKYLHTTDGGQTWIGSCPERFALTNLSSCSSVIPPEFWPVPRVISNRKVYVAFLANAPGNATNRIEIVEGTDQTSGPSAGQVQFQYLTVGPAPGTRLQIDMMRRRDPPGVGSLEEVTPMIPGGGVGGAIGETIGAGVDLAVDPMSPNRLYVVCHDTATADENDTDVNIYIYRLTRPSLTGFWTVHPRVRVNQDLNWPFPADQFMPSVKVDVSGRVHVVFYDDRKYNISSDQLDGLLTTHPKFDVFYARSVNQGTLWSNQELCDDPPSCATTQEALEYADFNAHSPPGPGSFFLRDYIGIDVGSDRVWTSFMGSSLLDTTAHKSLIWSSQILYTP